MREGAKEQGRCEEKPGETRRTVECLLTNYLSDAVSLSARHMQQEEHKTNRKGVSCILKGPSPWQRPHG